MKIYNSNISEAMKTSSPVFKAVENEFNNWMDNSNPAMEYADMYFSEDAIYDKKGAIQSAIEQIFEVMEENNLPFIYLNDSRLDLDCAFAD